ncbi:hypothetical protein EVAR_60016_1 [Eumeta japonica]|uniref:PiggyBac transposable element-derived protein domain-containing protein n=1 Tax=Eumeta variegata TaxID=151549 RepID=A0A4C1ZGP3_EUMVA|nr:hypothetical protein EVAR_60016_1 [Eumeta japonica]
MDAEQEKSLNGDVNLKWGRNFATFDAVREEFLVHLVGGMKYYDSPYDPIIDIFDEEIMKGKIIAHHFGDIIVMAWKDAKIVSTISTFYDNITYMGTKDG